MATRWRQRRFFSSPSARSSYSSTSASSSAPSSANAAAAEAAEPLDSLTMKADSLVTALVMGSAHEQKQTVHRLRLMSKADDEHRLCIAQAGAIPHLLQQLSSADAEVQADAITCVLNLSIARDNKKRLMASSVALDRVTDTLRAPSAEARRNAAAVIFSLATEKEYRDSIGQRPLLVPSLVELMREDSAAAAKDATRALFHLSLSHSNKLRVIQAGALPILCQVLGVDARSEWPREDALALLGQVCSCEEGASAFLEQEDRLGMLVSLLHPAEPPRCREQAAAALVKLCEGGGQHVVECLLKFDDCVSALCDLLSTGSRRAKSKAGALLQLLVVSDII